MGSIEEFQSQFQKRLSRASEYVCVDQQVSLFTADRINSIQLDVEMHSPPDLVHAMNIASSIWEEQKVMKATSSRNETWWGTRGYFNTTATSTIPTPKGNNALSGITEPKLVSSSTPSIKKKWQGLKWRREGQRDCIIIVMNCIRLGINVRNYFNWNLPNQMMKILTIKMCKSLKFPCMSSWDRSAQ